MKIKTIKINKERLKFEYDVNLSADKIFYTILPENIRILAEKFKIRFDEHRRKKGYIFCKTYEELDRRIEDIIEKIVSKKLASEEIVLLYRIKTNCAYCKTKAGALVPNGSYQQEIDGFYEWQSGTEQSGSFNRHPFGFDIYVKPRKKLTYKYYDKSTSIEYAMLDDNDTENDKILKWLNSICNIGSDFDKPKEIIYTPKVGIFFVEALKFIFRFNEQLKLILTKDQELNVKNLNLLSFKDNPKTK